MTAQEYDNHDSNARASDPPDSSTVRGERGSPAVGGHRSLQSRVSSVMACGLMCVTGIGMLAWYYTNAFTAGPKARRAAQAATIDRAQGEMVLPPIGPVEVVAGRDPADRHAGGPGIKSTIPNPVQGVQQAGTQYSSLLSSPSLPASVGGYAAAPQKSAAELQMERRLSGAAFLRTSQSPGADSAQREDSGLASLLKSSVSISARAQLLPERRFVIPKGAFIDCTLETAIDSTLPGLTTCVTATDTFGFDGNVVLLERGTKLVGETRGQVQQGSARVFVIWTEARTPSGVVVPLDSPGADELGRSGLSGEVDRHFWARFGAAILISTLDGAVQSAVQASDRGSGTMIYNPSNSEAVVTESLKNSVNIPPTVRKANGDRIQVLVARDVDFREVYELRTHVAVP